MIRAFQNDSRIATAVFLKDNTLLQVYPEKKSFATLEEWKATFPEATFETQDRPAVVKVTREEKLMKKIKSELSLPVSTDSPMQRVVRQLFFQLGLRDSLICYYTSNDSSSPPPPPFLYPRRHESGLYVMIPSEGRITPVHFNYKSGHVFFSGKNQVATSPDDLLFVRKELYDMVRIQPIFQTQAPDQKAVIILSTNWNNKSQQSLATTLVSAGYYVLFMMNSYYPTSEMVKLLYSLPNVKGVLSTNYGNEMNVYSVPKEGESSGPYNSTRMTIGMWLSKNA